MLLLAANLDQLGAIIAAISALIGSGVIHNRRQAKKAVQYSISNDRVFRGHVASMLPLVRSLRETLLMNALKPDPLDPEGSLAAACELFLVNADNLLVGSNGNGHDAL